MSGLYLFLGNRAVFLNMIRQGIVLDTKMLILYLIGIFDSRNNTDYLKRFGYDYFDFETVIRFKEAMKIERFVVTPNILTEFFNQAENKIGGWFFASNAGFIKPFIKQLSENYCGKDEIMEIPKFGEFDFTDLSIYLTSRNRDYNLITCDRKLYELCKGNTKKITILFEELKNLRYSMR